MNEIDYISRYGYISHVLNAIPNIGKLKYLELGIQQGLNFNRIRCKDKTSVDVDPLWKAQYVMTTDEYFRKYNERFDIIFIDADHHYNQVVKDFNNAVKRCDKYLFLHDVFPIEKSFAVEGRCIDAYKLLYYLVKENICSPITLDCYQGLTLITMPVKEIQPPKEIDKVTYEEFRSSMNNFRLYTVNQMQEWLRNDNGVQ